MATIADTFENRETMYDIRPDLEDQALGYFKVVLTSTIVMGGIVFGFHAALNSGSFFPWLWLGLFMLVSYYALSRNHPSFAVTAYFIGIIGTFSLSMSDFGPTVTQFSLMMIPIILASLISKDRLPVIAAVVSVLEFILIWKSLSIAEAFRVGSIPIMINGLLAFVISYRENDILETVYWATDIQKKDRRRADAFYQQREELNRAMLQLAHAHSKLELTNVDLIAAREKADRVSQAKSVFLSNMSHELRTPLNVIIGYSSSMLRMPQMFENTPVPEIFRPYLQLIEDNGHYLVGLINDVLDLSKIEAGKLELHCASVELPSLLRGIASTSIGLIKDKPLTIRPDFAEDLPPVWADPMRVRQILLNLMSNAIKFTHTGSVTLSAVVTGDFVSISVIDTGIGIAENAQRTIFDRFQQAAQNIEVQYGGTGLGLDISKQLSLMHGGNLTVKSTTGQGSTFTLTLPIVSETHIPASVLSNDDTLSRAQAMATAVTEPNKNCFVLVVEDEVNSRELIKLTLESNGYQTIFTNDGQEAVDFATGFLPDVIILDIHLPTLNGWKVLKLLKDQPETAHIPVIVYTIDERSDMAASLGAALFINKPATAEQLLHSVEEVTAQTTQVGLK